ncbi:hypothetical protein BDV39DRAFT_205062 [Aspergillus sergii]|uniref:Uncharacterized protein n=1 Tax=Aspergillus sergii TaxID=1034303 RepID=A0A5N6X4Z8_9EURO|nr:hypothetical protein BDV39DRAFT_205062 [Aspergillus sergii]
MVEVAPLVLGITSLVGVLTAALVGWYNMRSNVRICRQKAERLFAKYGEPLYCAAKNLLYRLHNILDQGMLLMEVGRNPILNLQLQDYTYFTFGQLFAWIHILRHQAQFVCVSSEKDNRRLVDKLKQIYRTLSVSRYNGMGNCMLWRGQQMAIGEIMTKKAETEDSQLICLGYSEFLQKFEQEPAFKE